jgi:hypothetical protein
VHEVVFDPNLAAGDLALGNSALGIGDAVFPGRLSSMEDSSAGLFGRVVERAAGGAVAGDAAGSSLWIVVGSQSIEPTLVAGSFGAGAVVDVKVGLRVFEATAGLLCTQGSRALDRKPLECDRDRVIITCRRACSESRPYGARQPACCPVLHTSTMHTVSRGASPSQRL